MQHSGRREQRAGRLAGPELPSALPEPPQRSGLPSRRCSPRLPPGPLASARAAFPRSGQRLTATADGLGPAPPSRRRRGVSLSSRRPSMRSFNALPRGRSRPKPAWFGTWFSTGKPALGSAVPPARSPAAAPRGAGWGGGGKTGATSPRWRRHPRASFPPPPAPRGEQEPRHPPHHHPPSPALALPLPPAARSLPPPRRGPRPPQHGGGAGL